MHISQTNTGWNNFKKKKKIEKLSAFNEKYVNIAILQCYFSIIFNIFSVLILIKV